jgi:hypothetical protein
MLYLYHLTLIRLKCLEWEKELKFESLNALAPNGKDGRGQVTAIGWMTAGRLRQK